MSTQLWLWMSWVRAPVVALTFDKPYLVVKVRSEVEPIICPGGRLHCSIVLRFWFWQREHETVFTGELLHHCRVKAFVATQVGIGRTFKFARAFPREDGFP